jgi:gentisate 1,2-dioxygenase
VRIVKGERIATQARATSQAFYVIRGKGLTRTAEHGEVRWGQGDLFVLPSTTEPAEHFADAEEAGGEDVALYWVSDEPLMKVRGWVDGGAVGG